jgi:hypothetical protein
VNSERDQIQFGMTMLEHLEVVEAPESIWASIEAALNQPTPIRHAKPPASHFWRWAIAATVVAILAVSFSVNIRRSTWIQTTANSRTIAIGYIGTVDIQPNTRLRIVTEKPAEHRLMLAHGEIRAKISAPPRLFFVDTKSGTAIDLGCEYALNMQETGSGLLRVTKGWVSFQWKGRESLVPAGASCKIHADAGPGVPSFDDAADSFKQALEDDALDSILAGARVRDTLSLWHLLARVDEKDRARVYDRIAALTTLPASISRDRALRLDQETLSKLKEELAWTW